MKRISLSLVAVLFSFCLMEVVNAAETGLDSVASLNSVIGGTDESIVYTGPQADKSKYKFYYKTVAINDSDFSAYASSKYTVDNGDDSSDEYATAQSRVVEYEQTFDGLITTLSSTSDLSSWTESSNNEITLKDLKYEEGKHHGYVLGVAAVKDGDSNVYVSRSILESKSATTLGILEYNDSDKTTYESTTTQVTTNEEVTTEENPETGIEDYAIYLVPLSIFLGSGIILRRNYA